MTMVSPERNFSSREDTLPQNTPARTTEDIVVRGTDTLKPIENNYFHNGPTPREEEAVFLGRQATNLAIAIGVSDDPDVKLREAERFLGNTGYVEPVTVEVALSKQAFALLIVDKLEGKVKTETAAALRAQNEALREQFKDLKEKLKTQLSKEDLLAVASLLKLPQVVEIDAEEFASEVQVALTPTEELVMPSTAELEARLEHVTDDTRSPGRGIAMIGHWTVDILKKSRDYILPMNDEEVVVTRHIDVINQ